MAAAAEKRLEVLRRIRDVLADKRLYENCEKSRSVRVEVDYLLDHGLIEPCERDGEPGYRRTDAGEAWLAEHEES